MIKIMEVQTAAELRQIKDLFRAYFQYLTQELGLATSEQDIVEELAGLPGGFAPPHGRLAMASLPEKPIGCAGLRPMGEQACELKRMFVLPQFRGQGAGKALARRLIEDARIIGYASMRLVTGDFLTPAICLYESLGFQRIEPYCALPEEFRRIAIFMELRLK